MIGAITALAGLVWAFVALQRAGLDLNALNPFLWHRRRQWNKKYREKPIYCLGDPMEAAALLLLGAAKCEGEISSEQKQEILSIYENEFKLGRDEASDLLLASAHLLREEIYLVDNLNRILEKSGPSFTPEQVESLIALMQRVSVIESGLNDEQRKLIQATRSYFAQTSKGNGKWN
jgi:uncharacterized tellurite resistance protein B-like protein